MRQKGSMTVTMSLMLAVLLSLFAACMQSVREACARAKAVSSIDAGLYSLFSEYDRDLLEDYNLFFLDAGYGTGKADVSQIINRTEYFMNPLLGTGLAKSTLQVCAVDGYRLAADERCRSVQLQIVRYMKENLGNKGIELLKSQFDRQQDELSGQKAIQEQGMTEQSTEVSPLEGISRDNNPLEIVKSIKRNGFLGFVLPAGQDVSEKETDIKTVLSHRNLPKGMGQGWEQGKSSGVTDKLLIQEYILEKLGSFTEQKQEGRLSYQAEYVLGGKSKDEDNLKYVINRLILIREAANLAYLYTDAQKRSELAACAAALSLLLLIPEGTALIQTVLAGAWAYAESVSDVKILLSGGKVPLAKDVSSWKTQLAHLDMEKTASNKNGIDYRGYLGILLSFSSKENLTIRCMDMIEQNIQSKPGREGFSMDACLDWIAMSYEIAGPNGRIWQAERTYTYDM